MLKTERRHFTSVSFEFGSVPVPFIFYYIVTKLRLFNPILSNVDDSNVSKFIELKMNTEHMRQGDLLFLHIFIINF